MPIQIPCLFFIRLLAFCLVLFLSYMKSSYVLTLTINQTYDLQIFSLFFFFLCVKFYS